MKQVYKNQFYSKNKSNIKLIAAAFVVEAIKWLKEAVYLWVTMTIEIILGTILYVILRVAGVNQDTTVIISMAFCLVLVIVGLVIGTKKKWIYR